MEMKDEKMNGMDFTNPPKFKFLLVNFMKSIYKYIYYFYNINLL